MVIGIGDVEDRPQKAAENKAFLGVLAVLSHLGGQGLPFVGGEIGGSLASPEALCYLTHCVCGDVDSRSPLEPCQPSSNHNTYFSQLHLGWSWLHGMEHLGRDVESGVGYVGHPRF